MRRVRRRGGVRETWERKYVVRGSWAIFVLVSTCRWNGIISGDSLYSLYMQLSGDIASG